MLFTCLFMNEVGGDSVLFTCLFMNEVGVDSMLFTLFVYE